MAEDKAAEPIVVIVRQGGHEHAFWNSENYAIRVESRRHFRRVFGKEPDDVHHYPIGHKTVITITQGVPEDQEVYE